VEQARGKRRGVRCRSSRRGGPCVLRRAWRGGAGPFQPACSSQVVGTPTAVSDGHIADGHIADGDIADGDVADGHIADGHIRDRGTPATKGRPSSSHVVGTLRYLPRRGAAEVITNVVIANAPMQRLPRRGAAELLALSPRRCRAGCSLRVSAVAWPARHGPQLLALNPCALSPSAVASRPHLPSP
jgi:hypothetical protein